MVELKKLEGKNIILTDIDGDTFEGYVSEYIFPDDNYPEEVEGITIDYPIKNGKIEYEYIVQFNKPEIKSIEILD